jgi:spore germination cell wall hydrolase CwlJ-like protein
MRDAMVDAWASRRAICVPPKQSRSDEVRSFKTPIQTSFSTPVRTVVAGLAAALLMAAPGAAAEVTKMTRGAPAAAPGPADLGCMAEAVYFEAGGTGAKGETAVAHVILNRARSPEFPGSVCGVVRQGCQFSYRCDGKSDALASGARREKAIAIARAVLAGAPDITNGALFFHSASAAPGWFKTRPRVGRIGGNIFYR